MSGALPWAWLPNAVTYSRVGVAFGLIAGDLQFCPSDLPKVNCVSWHTIGAVPTASLPLRPAAMARRPRLLYGPPWPLGGIGPWPLWRHGASTIHSGRVPAS